MEQSKLMQFIQRIIDTSADSYTAVLALEQLKEILSRELDREAQSLMNAAIEGARASLAEMKAPQALSTTEALHASATRAIERRRREDEAARHGRC